MPAADSAPSLSRLIRVYLGLAFLVVIWGNAFVAIRHAVQFMTPIELAAARFLPVVLILGSWLLICDRDGLWQLVHSDWPRLLLMSLVGVTTYHLAINTGQTRVPAGTASLIVAFSPAVAAILAAIFLHERITLLKVCGLIVSFVGLVVVVTFGQGIQFDTRNLGYYLLVLLAACAWGSYSVLGQSLLSGHPQMRVMAASLSLGGLPLVLLAPPDVWPRLLNLPVRAWVDIAFLSLLCTVLAYVFWLQGIRYLGAARVASFNYLFPLLAVLGGAVLLGERITWGQVGGGALILAGVIAVNRK